MSAQDLGRAALARRKAELRISQKELRARTGLSAQTISNIEHGDPTVSIRSLRRLDVGLEWQVGTAESWRAGRGGVVTRPTTEQTELEAMAERLVPLVAEALRELRRPETLTAKLAALPASVAAALEALVDQLLLALGEEDEERGGRGGT